MNRLGYTTTRNKRTELADCQNIATADPISWLGEAALATGVHPAALVPFSADVPRLRRIMLVLLDGATTLVVQLIDGSGITGRADLPGLSGANFLSRVVEWSTDVAGCARKSSRNLAGGLMGEVPDPPFGLAPLQPLPLPRAFDLLALLCLK